MVLENKRKRARQRERLGQNVEIFSFSMKFQLGFAGDNVTANTQNLIKEKKKTTTLIATPEWQQKISN